MHTMWISHEHDVGITCILCEQLHISCDNLIHIYSALIHIHIDDSFTAFYHVGITCITYSYHIL